MRRLADRFVRPIARTSTLGWFRAVEVTGLQRIPRTEPVLLVAGHDGGFVDPALLLATNTCDRRHGDTPDSPIRRDGA
jgi:1-acyl-sn-glycerol-3-phosphate acyltransferase